MFDLIGETLRRLRRERDLTLEDVRTKAGLGRGQLSRIENQRQEATLSTLAKILDSQGVSRAEFFQRYELVETETSAVRRQKADGAEIDWPEQIRAVVTKVSSYVPFSPEPPRPIAQGAVEVGDFVVLFRVVPKDVGAPPPSNAGGETSKLRAGKSRESAGRPSRRSGSIGRKRKR